MSRLPTYCCPEAGCAHRSLTRGPEGLLCENGHRFPFIPGTDIPVFACETVGANEYAQEDAAQVHDNALRWVFDTFRAEESGLRERLIARLNLRRGQRVLVTGAGAGNDLPYLAQALGGSGEIHAQDIAQDMLLAGVTRHRHLGEDSGVALHFSVSDATNLPYPDGWFDAAYHFGGINLFLDIAKGMAEMNRVVAPGGTIVIGDEGLAPWLAQTELGGMLVSNNALYACQVPLAALPPTVLNVRVSWELSHCFYVITFEAGTDMPDINIDVPHLGRRGGSIRSRYLGRLEGIDPALRDRVYAEAERRGMSRVALLEKALRASLGED